MHSLIAIKWQANQNFQRKIYGEIRNPKNRNSEVHMFAYCHTLMTSEKVAKLVMRVLRLSKNFCAATQIKTTNCK